MIPKRLYAGTRFRRLLFVSMSVVWGAAAAAATAPTAPYTADEYTRLLYHCDGQGAQLLDSGPLHLHADVIGALRTRGRFGGALDTRQGGAVLRYHPALNLQYALTIEAWVRVDGASRDIQRIAFRSAVYGLYLDRSGTNLTFFVNVDGRWTSLRGSIPLRKWVHVAGTFDGERMRLYIDGAPVDEKRIRGTIVYSSAPFEIGAEVIARRRFLNGAVDEIRLSSVARTDFQKVLTFEPTVAARVISSSGSFGRAPTPEAVVGRAPESPTIDGKLDDPVWKDACEIRLRSVRLDQRVQPTIARLAWDDRRLYVAVHCREVRMARVRARVRDHDGAVWGDDCVEVFLQPPGSEAWYHLAVNSLGTLYDARCNPRGDASWESGAQVRTARSRDEWTVETAIPFAAFGAAPVVGTTWRGNICRERVQGRELSTWAPVGRRFHTPSRFGVLRFAERPEQAPAGVTRLEGVVETADGRRAANIPIRTVLGVVRSDVRGRFIVDGLPAGRTRLEIGSPRYQPLSVEVDLKNRRERVLLPPVREVDPDAIEQNDAVQMGDWQVAPVPPLDDLDPVHMPAAEENRGAEVHAFAAPGECESIGAVIMTGRDLHGVRVACSDLAGPGGSRIGAQNIDVRVVKRLFVRKHYSLPPEEVAPRSRYLLEPRPFDMHRNTFRRVHAIVHVPEDAKAGRYTGTLEVTTVDGGRRTLAVRFDVLPLALHAPRRHYGLYYRRRLLPEQEETVRRELMDIRRHGGDRLLWTPRITYTRDGDEVRISYDEVLPYLDMLKEFGFVGPYIVWDGFERLSSMTDGETGTLFRTKAKEAILGLQRLRREHGWPEIVLTHMDEVFGRDRLDRFIRLAQAIRQVPGQRIYITFHNRPQPGVAEMIRRIDPYVDIRCYHGHSIDEWLAAGHTFDEFAEELKRSGDEAWCYYNPRSIEVTPEWARLTNGFWLWLTPVTTHVPWCYSSPKGDPLDDADGYDYGYAFTVGDEIVPTRLWEGYREGVDDMRYISTLEDLLDQVRARRLDVPEAVEAEKWLRDLRRTLLSLPLEQEQSALVKAISARYSQADYDAWRRKCAEFAIRLARRLGRK